MARANLAYSCRDYEAAYQLYRKLLDTYPKDARLLTMAGETADRTGRPEEAVLLYERAFSENNRYSWNLRVRLMQDFIRLGRWQDFEAERLDTRKASLSGRDSTLPADKGYIIENPGTGHEFFNVMEFPSLHGDDHTRERYVLYEEKDPCTGFTPYIDLESPGAGSVPTDGSPATDRTFSLVAFPSLNTRWLLKTYPKGEPDYKTVRADVLSVLVKPLTLHFNANTPCPAA
ncbi:MAG TPA: tetratricopeptide repeat protein [Acidobacteriaceae bacterium]|nr:tetratricopeptide repeat protein [Acidobacteriaceae bacterium]